MLQRFDDPSTREVTSHAADVTLTGPLFTLEAGIDRRLSDWFAAGPVLSFGMGSYGSANAIPFSSNALHSWLTLGLRVQARSPLED